jgi:FtsP/CotA-like multicopper oxidase with cupredoxin domain
MGRQGFARASLAPREGMPAEPLPPHRPRPVLTMADMGMSFGPTGLDRGTPLPETDRPGHVAPMDMDHGSMGGMDHEGGAHAGHQMVQPQQQGHQGMDHSAMPGMDHSRMGHGAPPAAPGGAAPSSAAAAHAAMGHGGMAMPDPVTNDTGAPSGARVLSYRDLRALANPYGDAPPDRIIEIRLTGNMERYFWSINGNKFSEAQPIVLNYGERGRFRFINETMMNHPMHLHGMWMIPQVGNGAESPMLHVVNVKPGTVLDVDIPADAEGGWAFHCHLLYHMESGMMRKVVVQRQRTAAAVAR